MTHTLWKICSFELSIQFWGYELAGDAVEIAATMAENPERCQWDKRKHEIIGERYINGKRRAIPEWWALPYVGQAMLDGRLAGEKFT